ncbi:ATP-dependent RecD-like DNA helicase [Companilactobacillus ginsenosidimutans]|uniref:ATP-dependent RecD2 DNA helicase n=1 Tax=Companilactobacillus ginsenosidimutans TaxID=1007676 RepID=A0A0H4QIF8_9LACO|nr:ATP-dependent RecD-like DNA helicase [Companilactobacillus ginsenosidimutans]AKP66428.1 exodeoxyribonuclease V subunit alpha [Companilactobacillus ginsenosidimutans]
MTETQEKQYFVGTVKAIFFENPDNLFKIFTIKIKKTNTDWNATDIVITGSFGEISEEEEYKFEGHLVDHPKYGKQFQAETYHHSRPSGRKALINFFAGDEFPGIGKKTAEKIVDKLGDNAIDKIVRDPNALDFLKLGKEKTKKVVDQIANSNQAEQMLFELSNFGFGNTLSARIYQRYGGKTLDIINEDPYKLVLEIKGIGFKRADELARQLGIPEDDPRRIKGALIQIVSDIVNGSGDSYVKKDFLIQRALGTLRSYNTGNDLQEKINDCLKSLVNDGALIVEDNRVYDKDIFESEWSIAQSMKMIVDSYKGSDWKQSDYDDGLAKVEKQFKVQYDDSQQKAIEAALSHSIFLLTGGPGTGKTTIINGIVAMYAKLNDATLDPSAEDYSIALAAPTGRAAKHMGETTGLPAMTIHRLLGLTGTDDDETAEPTLDCKLLIIDEMSMVDTRLFKILITSVPPGTQVVLVGDRDQLPSVGPGQIFADLIKSEIFPTSILTDIHRQDDSSTIIQLAHDVNQGVVNQDVFINKSDRSFIPVTSRNVPEVVSQIVSKSGERGFDISDVQILAPMYRGTAGIDNLNSTIQDVVNPMTPKRKEVSVGNVHYRIKDKVVYLVNSPEDNVFNGEIGIIVGIILAKENTDKVDKIVIDFDGNEVTLDRKDWISNIALAYCTSIHKAQGSEFEMVILPLVNEESRMLRRNLLYTAITRSKKLLIMVGDQSAFQQSIQDKSTARNTTLRERLNNVFNKTTGAKNEITKNDEKQVEAVPDNDYLTLDKVMSNAINPMIGMENITPFDFMKKVNN